MNVTPACSDASARESTAVFSGSIEFASEMGSIRRQMQEALTEEESTRLAFHDAVKDALAITDAQINSWHDYLSVNRLHTDGCLRAAFYTVTGIVKLFTAVCEIGDRAQRRAPNLWTADVQDDFTHALERLEDIQESLAVLIDDEARSELRSALRDAGIESKMLDREDEEEADRTHKH